MDIKSEIARQLWLEEGAYMMRDDFDNELQQALRNAEIADLPPWDIAKLMEFVDIDGDGRVNLPELDIAIARVRSGVSEEE